MLVVASGVIKAMGLCKEPIRLHTSPPTGHVRAYTAVRDGEPSGAQSPTPDREEVPQPSASNPHPDGRTPHQFQMDLGDLGDAQLRQLTEDLHQEVALAPPRTHCWATGQTPAGHGDPNMDDQEVTFLRGRGWEPRGQPP